MKAKEKFKEWYLVWIRKKRPDYLKFNDDSIWRKWLRKPDAEKWGVYLEFFDSEGIVIEVLSEDLYGKKWYFIINNFDYELYLPTRQQAQTEAVKKAMEILEERL